MPNNYDMAEHWLEQSFERTDPQAGMECLAAAQIYALLAIADIISGALEMHATELIRNR